MNHRRLIRKTDQFVMELMAIRENDYYSMSRRRVFTVPRYLCWKAIYFEYVRTYQMIGDIHGKRDHASILSGIKTLEDLICTQPDIAAKFLQVQKFVNQMLARDFGEPRLDICQFVQGISDLNKPRWRRTY